MEQYGVLVDFPKMGISRRLLTEIPGSGVYKSSKIVGAEDRAKDQLSMFNDPDMTCSVVPLNEDGSFGPPIKSYRFADSAVRELKPEQT